MKVLFVYHNELEEGFMPASISSLGGITRDLNVESKLFDTSFWKDKDSNIPENDRQVRERTGEVKRVEGFDLERETIDIKERFYKTVEEYHPDLIAATSTSYEFDSLVDFILPAKTIFNIPLIIGGAHPTVAPERAINKEGVDMICRGEGEIAFSELLKRMEKGEDFYDIQNLWIKKDGRIIKNKIGNLIEMDNLPIPNWDLFDERHRMRPFEGELKNYGFFEISRGCPYSCSYCVNSKIHKIYKESEINSGVYRFHSPSEVIQRMKKFKEKYGFNHIQLVDENLTVMPLSNLESLAEMYIQEIGVGFFTMGRPETIVNHPKKAELLAKMGCRMFALGAESGSETLRKEILNRPMKNETLEEAAKILKENGILVSLYNIIGFPTETKSMIFDTIRLNRRIQPDRYSVRFLVPYPGTDIRSYCVDKGYLEENYENQRKMVSFLIEPILDLPSPPHPTKQELIEIKNNFGNYIHMSEEEFEKIRKY